MLNSGVGPEDDSEKLDINLHCTYNTFFPLLLLRAEGEWEYFKLCTDPHFTLISVKLKVLSDGRGQGVAVLSPTGTVCRLILN